MYENEGRFLMHLGSCRGLGVRIVAVAVIALFVPISLDLPAFGQAGSSLDAAPVVSAGSYGYLLEHHSSHYYRIRLARGETILLTLQPANNDFNLYFYDPGQIQRASATRQADDSLVRTIRHLAEVEGYYFIRVENTGDQSGWYSLTITLPTPGTYFGAALEVLDTSYRFTIPAYTDHYVKINLSRSQTLTAYLVMPPEADFDLSLYSSSHDLITSSTQQARGIVEAVQYQVSLPDTYFLQVQNRYGSSGTYFLTLGKVTLEVIHTGWGSLSSPVEVSPGDTGVSYLVTIRDQSNYTLSNLKATLFLTKPFSTTYSDQKATATYNRTLGYGETATFNFKLNIADDALLKTYDMCMIVNYYAVSEGGLIYQNPLNLTATGEITGRSFLKVTPSRQYLAAGDTSNVNLKIANDGTAEASSLEIGVTVPAPLLLEGGDNKWLSPSLKPGESSTVSLALYTPAFSLDNTYQLTISLKYRTVVGSTITDTRTIALRVADEEDIRLDVTISGQRLEAGEAGNVTLTVSNTGPVDANTLQISLALPSPLAIMNRDNHWSFPYLEVGKNITVTISMYAPQQSQGLSYASSLKIDYETPSGVSKSDSRTLTFTVRSPETSVRFSIATSEFDLLATVVNDVALTMENQGASPAQSVTVTLNLPPALSIVGSDNQWYLPSLGPGSKTTLATKIFASEATLGGSYQSTLSIKYKDAYGYEKTDDLSLGLSVRGYIDLRITGIILRPDPALTQRSLTVSGIIINGGIISAKTVNVSAIQEPPFRVKSAGSTIIGDIPKDGQASFSLTVNVDQADSGEYPLKLLVTYKDDRNRLNVQSTTIPVEVIPPPQSSESSGSQIFGIPTVSNLVAALIAFVAGAVLTTVISKRRHRSSK